MSCYFIAIHPYCQGNSESAQWTVEQWLSDQNIHIYNQMNDLWVEIDSILRENPWDIEGVGSNVLKMAFTACFNVDKWRSFVFESTFLSRFHIPQDRIQNCKDSDLERMKLGFDWVKYFLKGTGPLSLK